VATFTTETVTTVTRRWVVPAHEPWGATAADISKAWAAAELAYREYYDVPKEQPLRDDALRFRARDEDIVISFDIERQTP
jgi:hypothetical protein